MTYNSYYNSNAAPQTAEIYDSNWVAYYGGIDPATSTPAELAAAGFYLYIATPAPQVNGQIYTVEATWVITGTDATQEYTVVPLPLTESKSTYVTQTNSQAYDILLPTDWLVVRSVENGTAIPADWNTWRQTIRVEAKNKVESIYACETADDLEAYVTSEAYAYWTPEPATPPQSSNAAE
jgi:NADH:ubiquinone oxidoreductase subunit